MRLTVGKWYTCPIGFRVAICKLLELSDTHARVAVYMYGIHGVETTTFAKLLREMTANPHPMVRMITGGAVTLPDSEDIEWVPDNALN